MEKLYGSFQVSLHKCKLNFRLYRKHIGMFDTLPSPSSAQAGQVALPGVIRNTYFDEKGLQYIRVAQARVAQIMAGFATPLHSSQAQVAEHGVLPRQSPHDIEGSRHAEPLHMEKVYGELASCMGKVSACTAQLVNIPCTDLDYTDKHQKAVDEL